MSTVKPRVRVRVQSENKEKSLTKKADQARSNINNIMSKYHKTGLVPQVQAKPIYTDLPPADNYHAAMNMVVETNQLFDSLPASIRSDFKNDPRKFLEFASNPENLEIMADMGLVDRPLSSTNASTTTSSGQQEPPSGGDVEASTDASTEATSGA